MARSRDERITGSATGQPQEILEAGTRQILRAEQGRIRESLDRSHQGHWCMRVEQARPQAEITGMESSGEQFTWAILRVVRALNGEPSQPTDGAT